MWRLLLKSCMIHQLCVYLRYETEDHHAFLNSLTDKEQLERKYVLFLLKTQIVAFQVFEI